MLFIEYKTTNYLFDISFLNFELPYISQCFVLHFVRKQNIFPQICIVLLFYYITSPTTTYFTVRIENIMILSFYFKWYVRKKMHDAQL